MSALTYVTSSWKFIVSSWFLKVCLRSPLLTFTFAKIQRTYHELTCSFFNYAFWQKVLELKKAGHVFVCSFSFQHGLAQTNYFWFIFFPWHRFKSTQASGSILKLAGVKIFDKFLWHEGRQLAASQACLDRFVRCSTAQAANITVVMP